jgi:transcriptional regulator with XRE-family HTH domain
MEPEELGLGLTLMRDIRHWSQAELAKAAGVAASALSNYERGETTPSSRTLERLLRALGFGAAGLEQTVSFIRSLRRGETRRPAHRELALALELLLEEKVLPRSGMQARAREADPVERRRAPALLARFQPYPAETRRAIVMESEELRSWALCELLCEESEKAAARSGAGALELAELALLVAELLLMEDESFLSCLQGYAWAFVGNARRVQSDLPGADEAFARFRRLWRAGGGDAGLLDEARPLDLEASLRRDQRRLPEALDLLRKALPLARSDGARGRILIKKAKTLEELGRYEEAVATLNTAAPLVDRDKDPRLDLCLRFNLLENLFQTGQLAEAAPMFDRVKELTVALGNDLDLIRLRWLEARVAAGLGRLEVAELAFREVAEELAARGIGYDAGLVLLELAELLARQDRNEDVKQLAAQAVPLFKLQGVGREMLASLTLLVEVAEKDTLTVGLAKRLLQDLEGQAPEGGGEESPGL